MQETVRDQLLDDLGKAATRAGMGDAPGADDDAADARLLRPHVLLHLHRFGPEQRADPHCIRREVERLSAKLRERQMNVPTELRAAPTYRIPLHETLLRSVDPVTATLVHANLHYLGSSRAGAVHLGLYSASAPGGRTGLLSLVSLSAFDLAHLADALPIGVQPEHVLVLSRQFAFAWAPRNALSYTLSRVNAWLRHSLPDVKLLLTYVDPNVGYRGTVYRAANWVFFGREHKRRYLYLDGDYVTDRHMIREFGTADFERLRAMFASRVERSVVPLRPLEIFAYYLRPDLRRRGAGRPPHEFLPPAWLVGG